MSPFCFYRYITQLIIKTNYISVCRFFILYGQITKTLKWQVFKKYKGFDYAFKGPSPKYKNILCSVFRRLLESDNRLLKIKNANQKNLTKKY